jgi:lipopolysaccharide/colanic/teichoic acid biosynthesis glycosyltransferase
MSAEHRFPPIARALLLLSPLFLIMAILIKLDSPGPVPFLQRR